MLQRPPQLQFWLITLLALAGCASPTTVNPVSTPTAARTETSTPSATPFPSIAPTATPTYLVRYVPTRTPTFTQTKTPTPILTFAPATPLADNARYRLVKWEAEKADGLVSLARGNALTNSSSYFGFPDHELAPSVVAALSEAIQRFPDTERITNWRWDRAYHLAVSSHSIEDDRAGQEYAALMTNALNANEVTIDTLDQWFQRHQDRWSLTVASVETSPEYLAGYTVNIQPEFDELGGTCLLLLQDTGGFRYYVVISGYNYRDIEAAVRLWLGCGPVDVTGDGIDEISSGFYFGGHLGESQDSFYSLVEFPPKRLAFGPFGPYEEGGWNREVIVQDREGSSPTVFVSDFLFPCNVELNNRIDLRWNGQWLEEAPAQFNIDSPLDLSSLTGCWSTFNGLFDQVEPLAGVSLMQTVLAHLSPDIFPSVPTPTPQYPGLVSGEPSVEIIDEYRYRLGIYTSLVGNSTGAIQVLTDIIANPTISTSTWVAPAQEFLEVYQSPDDLYRACAQAPLCNTRFAIEQLTKGLPPEAYPIAIKKLRSFGVPVLASGMFDFEGDGEAEWWFTTRARGQTQFYVLARWSEGIKALFVTELNGTPKITRLAPVEDRSLIQLDAGDAPIMFAFVRLHSTGEPFVSVVEPQESLPVNIAAQMIRQAEDDLFAGADPVTVREVLLSAQQLRDFDCQQLDCAEFTYLLGLTYELTGDEGPAVDAYLRLWREYPDSPFTIMARAKLEPAP